MFALETEARLAEVTVDWSWSANDQDVGHIPAAFSESELKREAEAMFVKHKLQADVDFKTTGKPFECFALIG